MAFSDWLPWNSLPRAVNAINDAIDDLFLGKRPSSHVDKSGSDFVGSGRSFGDPSVSSWAKPKSAVTSVSPATRDVFISPSNSGVSTYEDSFTVPEEVYGEWTPYLQYLKEQSEANNAFNIEQAEKQMNFQSEQNRIAMDFNAAEAARNREWQEMMSNTAHQREVQDLQAAGLNPVLSAMGGNGAAVTSGATASGVSSSGAKSEADTAFVGGLLNFLNNVMGYATSTATAGISAGAVMGAANINAAASMYASDNAYLSAQNNATTPWAILRRSVDQGISSARSTFGDQLRSSLPQWMQNIFSYYDVYRKAK